MNVLFQLLSEQELPALLDMMRDFYSQQQMRFDPQAARSAIGELLQLPELGQIYLVTVVALIVGNLRPART